MQPYATLVSRVQLRRHGDRVTERGLPPLVSLCTLPSDDVTISSNVPLGFPRLPGPGSPEHIHLLEEWIRHCDGHHQCLDYGESPTFLPTRLLDIGQSGSQRCRLICDTTPLVKANTRYLALSHRWGTPPKHGECDPMRGKIDRTFQRNIDRLVLGIPDSDLPPKYQDAVAVSRSLRIRYIWIDSLCIIQHDKNDPLDEDQGRDFVKEAEKMEQVFRSAYVTLAASCASSPAEHFLKPRPTRLSATLRTAENACYFASEAIDDFYHDVEQGHLMTRGWVFQERVLSRRTIFFTQKQTYWECGEGICCETLTRVKNPKSSLLGAANFPQSFPTHEPAKIVALYQSLYERYSRLKLSYPADRPSAIRGLETRLLRFLDTSGGCGVLDKYLHPGLLWQRSADKVTRIDFSSSGRHQPPSWSWMAYDGPIMYMVAGPALESELVGWSRDVAAPRWGGADHLEGEMAELSLALPATVRGIIPDLGQNAARRAFFDDPGRSFAGSEGSFKCVVVGSTKPSANDGPRGPIFYALIVVRTRVNGAGEYGNSYYQRAGVAKLRKHQMVWHEPAEQAYII
ncbi:heterokaryon incompatibility protein-domain-containing protein [Lasiosphaeria miniovina]|uniref:Heterokaryon incompatibility protein-domain-containing protein n=1 Tax=Lasiosphaeria miniovina TaxID=1954250 RepID=A0AA40AVW3_9PEZI|nr:heterokaryon incompatibility protein-domain-containing protein [Lasiosphaeria miniovina]KAK0722998.1 heterokaryon incompatibility protein-domain-containing protein [Lasiosphaeria miniovina]